MGDLIETIGGRHGPDLYVFEEYVETGVATHGCLQASAATAVRVTGEASESKCFNGRLVALVATEAVAIRFRSMSTDPPLEASPGESSADSESMDPRSQIIHRELERRLREFDDLDDAAFGEFTGVDWTICTLLFFVLPLLIAWWAF